MEHSFGFRPHGVVPLSTNNDNVNVNFQDDHQLLQMLNANNADAETAVTGFNVEKNLPLQLSTTPTPRCMEPVIKGGRKRQSSPAEPSKRAEHFPLAFIQIGEYKVTARHDAHVVAKCFYGKHKLVWEILDGALKNKMEILWAHISGMRVTLLETSSPGFLEFELSRPPDFYRETNPQRLKHTTWRPSSDFTNGEASKHRIHLLQFSPGLLIKCCNKLAQFDRRFLEMRRAPFPSSDSPFFDSDSSQERITRTRFSCCLRRPPASVTHPSTRISFKPLQFQQFLNGIPCDSLLPSSGMGLDCSTHNQILPTPPLASPQQLQQFQNAMTYQGSNGFGSSVNEIWSGQVGDALGGTCSSSNHVFIDQTFVPPVGLRQERFHNAIPTGQGITKQNVPASDEVIKNQRLQPQFSSQQVERFQYPARLSIDNLTSFDLRGPTSSSAPAPAPASAPDEATNKQIVNDGCAAANVSAEDCMKNGSDMNDVGKSSSGTFDGLSTEGDLADISSSSRSWRIYDSWNMEGFHTYVFNSCFSSEYGDQFPATTFPSSSTDHQNHG